MYEPVPPFRRDFDAARDPYTARNALGITTTGGGGGVSDAPSDGNIYGRQNAAWTNLAVTYAPLASPTFTGDPKAPTPSPGDNDTSIATTAFVTNAISTASGSYQPLDADLTSIAGYGGTGTWLYRSAANAWSAVSIGSGLSFSGGVLAAAAATALAVNVRVFTASGTYPTVTNASVKVLVYCKGGGGGGGGSNAGNRNGGGGGEGEETWKLTTAGVLSGGSMIVGAGGTNVVGGTNASGSAGGTTSTPVSSANGGSGGTSGPSGGAGGVGGSGGTKDWGFRGDVGQFGADIVLGTMGFSAAGGGKGGGTFGSAGATNSGGGGGGGSTGSNSGIGGSGIIVCIEYGAI